VKIIGLMPARSESWIIGLTARAALLWCDDLVMLDHASTDATFDIMCEIQRDHVGRVAVASQPCRAWDEMAHRQMLLEIARRRHATHIAIIDADELLTGNLLGQIRGLVETLPKGAILQPRIFNLRENPTGSDKLQFHASGMWSNRVASLAFADDSRLGWAGDGFHHREPFGMTLRPYCPAYPPYMGGILHFWGVSERRHRAKHALYKLVERLKFPKKPTREIDQYYNQGVYGTKVPTIGWDISGPQRLAIRPVGWDGPPVFETVQDEWLEPYGDLLRHLRVDADPWQEAEVKRLMVEHGQNAFSGLDLFGVV
jgi:Glycosyl transferase family 2